LDTNIFVVFHSRVWYNSWKLKAQEHTTMTKESDIRYGGRIPKGYQPAHNQVIHTAEFPHGLNGFRRFWIPPHYIENRGWAECPCGWNSHDPKWRIHYANPDHVDWWKSEIKNRGSLEAVYDHIIQRLNEEERAMEARGRLTREERAIEAKLQGKEDDYNENGEYGPRR
jgi:hypothetical protein